MVDAVKYGATEFNKALDANQIIEIIEKSTNTYIYQLL